MYVFGQKTQPHQTNSAHSLKGKRDIASLKAFSAEAGGGTILHASITGVQINAQALNSVDLA